MEAVVPDLKYSPGIWPERLRETTQNFIYDSQSLDRDLTQDLCDTIQKCYPLHLEVQSHVADSKMKGLATKR
jgi:hypothetical protein